MHIITIATDENPEWAVLLKRMQGAIDAVFSMSDTVDRLGEGKQIVGFANPEGSSWREKKGDEIVWVPYHVDVSSITSAAWQKDRKWVDVVSAANLALAWARVRAGLTRESLFDEIEIRLFERYLDRNIEHLQKRLLAYAEDAMAQSDRMAYWSPKSGQKARPQTLSRMEEEILSVAIIQRMGEEFSQLRQASYAYRLNLRQSSTEYLYDFWFDSYRAFTAAIREKAERHRGGAIIRADIESYYTRIAQELLLELASSQLHADSERVRWLLRRLLLGELASESHEPGHGIPQGGTGSGFFANVYMTPIDALFGVNNRYQVEILRYVDDLVLVFPDARDGERVLNQLQSKLAELELKLNEAKTEVCRVQEYLAHPDRDDVLDTLSEEFKALETPLWVMDFDHRDWFRRAHSHDERWWGLVRDYRRSLADIGIHIDECRISRKVWQYLWNLSKRVNDLGGGQELSFPTVTECPTPFRADVWTAVFQHRNQAWVNERQSLYERLVALFKDSLTELQDMGKGDPRRRRRLEMRLRFSVYRLCRLGIGGICQELTEMLKCSPGLLRQIRYTIEALAEQDHHNEIISLLQHYADRCEPMAQYMRAVLMRALRFLPTIDEVAWGALIDCIERPSSSAAEQLMATETLLHLVSGTEVKDLRTHAAAALRTVQLDGVLLPRLRKNYLLTLGACAPDKAVGRAGNEQDPLLTNAEEVVASGGAAELFLYPEPTIVRERYYSGDYPDHIDQDSPSG